MHCCFLCTTVTQCFVLIPNFQAIGLIAIDPQTLCSVPIDGVIKDWNKRPDTVDPHLSEHLGTKGWLDMRNVQITETGLNTL